MRGQMRKSNAVCEVVKRKIVTERKLVSEVWSTNVDTKYQNCCVHTWVHIESINTIPLIRAAEMSLKSLQNARIGRKTERAFQTRKKVCQ